MLAVPCYIAAGEPISKEKKKKKNIWYVHYCLCQCT